MPGGRVVVSTPGAINPVFERMEEAIVATMGRELGGFVGAVFSMHDPNELVGLLGGVGLDDVGAHVAPVTLRLPPPADLLAQYIAYTPLGMFMGDVADDARAELERRFVESTTPLLVDGALAGEQPVVVATGRRR